MPRDTTTHADVQKLISEGLALARMMEELNSRLRAWHGKQRVELDADVVINRTQGQGRSDYPAARFLDREWHLGRLIHSGHDVSIALDVERVRERTADLIDAQDQLFPQGK